MEENLDQVRQELADIHDQLLSLPTDAYDQRAQLQDRQNELRQLSAKLLEGKQLHDANSLKAAYKRLEQVRDRLLNRHLDPGSTEAFDSGSEAEFTALVNKAMDAGDGVDEIEARLQNIIQQLHSAE